MPTQFPALKQTNKWKNTKSQTPQSTSLLKSPKSFKNVHSYTNIYYFHCRGQAAKQTGMKKKEK